MKISGSRACQAQAPSSSNDLIVAPVVFKPDHARMAEDAASRRFLPLLRTLGGVNCFTEGESDAAGMAGEVAVDMRAACNCVVLRRRRGWGDSRSRAYRTSRSRSRASRRSRSRTSSCHGGRAPLRHRFTLVPPNSSSAKLKEALAASVNRPRPLIIALTKCTALRRPRRGDPPHVGPSPSRRRHGVSALRIRKSASDRRKRSAAADDVRSRSTAFATSTCRRADFAKLGFRLAPRPACVRRMLQCGEAVPTNASPRTRWTSFPRPPAAGRG